MSLLSLKRSLIINFFREFYQTLLLEKVSALSDHLVHLNNAERVILASVDIDATASATKKIAPQTEAEGANITSVTMQIQQTIQNLLTNQMDIAIKQGGEFVASYYKEAQYLMVAYTDELFLNLDWGSKIIWENNLLESRMYNTHVAGEAFFDMLDTYLKTRDPATKDLGTIYLWILGLGFQGKYRGIDDKGALKRYRQQLYRFILNKDPDFATTKTRVFPKAYGTTVKNNLLVKLPNPRFYNWSFWGVILLFFIGSFFIWYKETSPLRKMVDGIISIEQKGANFK